MEHLNLTLAGAGLEEMRELNIQISLVATLNVDAKTARRHVTAWLVSEVGNMLIGGSPRLVIGQRVVWQVPVILTSSDSGTAGQVGTVDVDAESGEVLVSDELRERILNNVSHTASPPLAPTG
jgi:hypothetical protein